MQFSGGGDYECSVLQCYPKNFSKVRICSLHVEFDSKIILTNCLPKVEAIAQAFAAFYTTALSIKEKCLRIH